MSQPYAHIGVIAVPFGYGGTAWRLARAGELGWYNVHRDQRGDGYVAIPPADYARHWELEGPQ